MPLPVPLAPVRTVTQSFLLVAVHAQEVRTEKVPAEPLTGTVAEGGERVYVPQDPPNCTITKLCPPTEMDPLRVSAPALAATVYATVPFPVPL